MRITIDDIYSPNRIRAAAIDLFGREGFGVGLRQIAEAADVSLGLIRHHFGSKADLRSECDRFVLKQTRLIKRNMTSTGYVAAPFMSQGAIPAEYLVLIRYILQTMRDGGPMARAFFDHMVEDSLQELESGVEAGVFKPSKDPKGRARYLVLSRLGELVLADSLGISLPDLTTPQLEIYTDGLLRDHSLLDTYSKQNPSSS